MCHPLNLRLCACLCVCVCLLPACVTSGRAIMLDTGMTMITVCHAVTHRDEGPGGCSLCHDKPQNRPATPLTPQTPATPQCPLSSPPRIHSHPRPTPSCSHVQVQCVYIFKEQFALRLELGFFFFRNGVIGYFGVKWWLDVTIVCCFVFKEMLTNLTILCSMPAHIFDSFWLFWSLHRKSWVVAIWLSQYAQIYVSLEVLPTHCLLDEMNL